MKESTVVFAVIFSILLAIVTIVLIGGNNQNVKVRSGLQECLITTPGGNNYTVWQKECK